MCKYPGNCSLSKGVKVEISLFKGQRLECAGLCRTGIRSQALFVGRVNGRSMIMECHNHIYNVTLLCILCRTQI